MRQQGTFEVVMRVVNMFSTASPLEWLYVDSDSSGVFSDNRTPAIQFLVRPTATSLSTMKITNSRFHSGRFMSELSRFREKTQIDPLPEIGRRVSQLPLNT